jgi:hypothetical protein
MDKFIYRGVRRTGWVSKNFFVVNNELKDTAFSRFREWQLHVKIPNPTGSHVKTRSLGYLWGVQVSTYYRLHPIKIMALSPKEKKASPYINKELFEFNNIKIMKLRQN